MGKDERGGPTASGRTALSIVIGLTLSTILVIYGLVMTMR